MSILYNKKHQTRIAVRKIMASRGIKRMERSILTHLLPKEDPCLIKDVWDIPFLGFKSLAPVSEEMYNLEQIMRLF